MKISKIIGTLSGVEDKVIIDDEVFYETNLVLEGTPYPARIPEYLRGISGKCEICCTLNSTHKNGKLFTYVNILTAEQLEDQKTRDLNSFKMVALIQRTTVSPIRSKGIISAQSKVSVFTDLETKKLSILHVTATGKTARKLAAIPEKSLVDLEGKIRLYQGCIYFTVNEIEVQCK